LGALFVCLATAGVLLYGAKDMPRVGDATAPANVHPDVVQRYMVRSLDHDGEHGEIGVPNVVTSVLGDYRGYDTLGETTVIFTAALCVVLLLRQAQSSRRRDEDDGVEAGR
jgi:multicomponent Na+:H+ antiporter subunit B